MSMSRRKPQVEIHFGSDFFDVPMARQEMASPLERCADQQEREYLLSLMVQISDDNVGPLRGCTTPPAQEVVLVRFARPILGAWRHVRRPKTIPARSVWRVPVTFEVFLDRRFAVIRAFCLWPSCLSQLQSSGSRLHLASCRKNGDL